MRFAWDRKKAAEARFVTLGHSASGNLLVVVHADQAGGIRTISARAATSAGSRSAQSEARVSADTGWRGFFGELAGPSVTVARVRPRL